MMEIKAMSLPAPDWEVGQDDQAFCSAKLLQQGGHYTKVVLMPYWLM